MHAKLLVTTGALLIAPLCIALADPVNQLVVFGDSLSDNGNLAKYAPLFLNGKTLAQDNYAANAFTDGPNTSPATTGPFGIWIDQFATKLGVSDPQPFYASGGTNYAFAGSNTAPGNNPSAIDAFDISAQVTAFSASNGGKAPSNDLYTIWGGANDLFNGVNGGKTAADNLYGDILSLASEGAKNFLWLNLPNLGDTPRGNAQGASSLNTATADFNNEWAVDLALLKSDGINVIGVDINTLFSDILANPSAYGFTNDTTPAQGLNGINPNDYLFWDVEHPTTAADTLIADAAYDAYAAPEPLSAGLSMLGIVAVLAAVKLRRKAVEI